MLGNDGQARSNYASYLERVLPKGFDVTEDNGERVVEQMGD